MFWKPNEPEPKNSLLERIGTLTVALLIVIIPVGGFVYLLSTPSDSPPTTYHYDYVEEDQEEYDEDEEDGVQIQFSPAPVPGGIKIAPNMYITPQTR